MQIEEQIKALLRTKAKIDLYRNVFKYVEESVALTKDFEADYPDLMKEFTAEVQAHCLERIEALGNPVKVQAPKPAREPVQEPAPQPQAKVETRPSDVEDEPTDLLKFLAKYKHLDNKKVIYYSKDGPVEGVVKGMIAPFLKIHLVTGHTVHDAAPKHVKEIK